MVENFHIHLSGSKSFQIFTFDVYNIKMLMTKFINNIVTCIFML